MYYVVHMSTTITIRTDEELREALEQRARAEGKTLSGLVREILENALEERPLEARTSHLRGRLELPGPGSDAWSRTIRDRNWRA
jgi:plasmid stability protein